MTFETDRLILRPITDQDAQDMFEFSKDEEVGRNAGWKPHYNIEETKEILKLVFTGNKDIFGIELKTNHKLIGSVGLIDDPKRENKKVKMIGYALGKDYWGNGYMTESAKVVVDYGFKVLNLDMISAYCYPSNSRSKNIFNKLGFEYEGTLSLCEEIYTGEVLDNECYKLLKK